MKLAGKRGNDMSKLREATSGTKNGQIGNCLPPWTTFELCIDQGPEFRCSDRILSNEVSRLFGARRGRGVRGHLPGSARMRFPGPTRMEATENIREAIEGYLKSLRKHGDPVPPSILEEVIEVPGG